MSFLEMAKAQSGNAVSAVSADSAASQKPAAALYRPLPVDHKLAQCLGLAGARREFLQAVELVAELSGRDPWTEAEALEALSRWWDRPVAGLAPVDWIVSAAHADKVMGTPRPRAGDDGAPLPGRTKGGDGTHDATRRQRRGRQARAQEVAGRAKADRRRLN